MSNNKYIHTVLYPHSQMPTAIPTVLHLTPSQVRIQNNFYTYITFIQLIFRPYSVSRDLVLYPAILAPAIGSKAVDTQCADNAHLRTGSSSVVCVGQMVSGLVRTLHVYVMQAMLKALSMVNRFVKVTIIFFQTIVYIVYFPILPNT